MCFSCNCDVIVIIVVVCTTVLMSNQHPIVLGVGKGITLPSSLRFCNLNTYVQSFSRKYIVITKLMDVELQENRLEMPFGDTYAVSEHALRLLSVVFTEKELNEDFYSKKHNFSIL